MNQEQAETSKKTAGKTNYRQWILIGILVFVGAAFLYDHFVLMPSATEKINKITDSSQNQSDVHEIAGMKPMEVYEYKGFEIERYEFPRGLPFYPKPILDVAYKSEKIAFFSREHMDEAFIDSRTSVSISTEERDKNLSLQQLNGQTQ